MKKKRKILFILHYPPPIHGAAMVGQYIKDSKVINSEFNCKYINLSTSTKIEEIGSGGIKKLIRFMAIALKVLMAMVSFRPNLCYFTLSSKEIGFYKDFLIVLITKLFAHKVVYHFHNKGVSEGHDKTINNFLYKIAFKNSHSILLSKHLYYDIKKYVKPENVSYCANGIPPNNVILEQKNKKAIPHILLLSNLIESKGIFVLLNACKTLKANGEKFKGIIVGGEGDITGEMLNHKIKELNLQNEVEYLGKKYGNDKALIFKQADIFAFPTFYHNEAFPLVNLEAMEYALPVISTNEGGIPEQIEDQETGFIIEKRNSKELAEKLSLLINDQTLCRAMGKKGLDKFLKHFTLEQFEQNITHILKRLV